MEQDEDLYLKAHKELNSKSKKEAVWIKALTLCKGDAEAAKYEYINLRVNEFKNVKLFKQSPLENKNNREFFSCEIHTAAQLIKDIAKSDFKYEEINYSIENEQINNKFPIKKYVLNFLDENWKIVIVVSFLCIYMLFNA